MLNSQFCASTVFSSPLLSWGMTMEESSGLNQDRENVSDFIKKNTHDFVWTHEVCVNEKVCMFIGLAVHDIVCVCVISVPSVREADVSLFSFGHFLMPFDMNMNVIKSTPSSYSWSWATAVSGPENCCQRTAIRLSWHVLSWQWKLNRIYTWHLVCLCVCVLRFLLVC